jgi:hypothetical protein
MREWVAGRRAAIEMGSTDVGHDSDNHREIRGRENIGAMLKVSEDTPTSERRRRSDSGEPPSEAETPSA